MSPIEGPSLLGVVQARMGSSRFPGKVLRSLGERPVVEWVVRAARESAALSDVVVATTEDEADDQIEGFCVAEGVSCVRGSQDDVLDRFLRVLTQHPADGVVRLTADNPLVDPAVLVATARAFGSGDFDLLSSTHPSSLPTGVGVEVVSADALRRASALASSREREHVTATLYRLPSEFRLGSLVYQPPADDLRVTMDTEEDAALLDALVAELGDRPPSWREVVALLRSRPDLVALNADVRQRTFEEG